MSRIPIILNKSRCLQSLQIDGNRHVEEQIGQAAVSYAVHVRRFQVVRMSWEVLVSFQHHVSFEVVLLRYLNFGRMNQGELG